MFACLTGAALDRIEESRRDPLVVGRQDKAEARMVTIQEVASYP